MLNPFDILQTKISFLVVKAMGALPDAKAGWVQASLVVLVHDLWRFLAVDPHMFLDVT